MTPESRYLLSLARRVASVYGALPGARGALVAGSVAMGCSDRYSDIDLPIYYDALPDDEALEGAHRQLSDAPPVWALGSRDGGTLMIALRIDGVEVQVVHATVEAIDGLFKAIQEELDVISPYQKGLSGIVEGVALFGDDYIAQLKARAAAYPDALGRKMVTAHLSFFPIWSGYEWLAPRDIGPWYQQIRVDNIKNVLAVLAGLNRVYFSFFQLKHTGDLLAKFHVAPPDLPQLLERALDPDPLASNVAQRELVAQTIALVEARLPDIDTAPARRQLDRTWEPWALPPPS